MRKIIVAVLMFVSVNAHASDIKMIFWYPGEAGTTREAQPILDTFLDYVSGKIKTTKLTGKYFNTTEEGLSFIASQKPAIGIISYAAWEENKSKFPNAQIWLATNPLPHGQKQESYVLVGKSSAGAVFSSEPLSIDFVKNQLGFNVEAKPQSTSQILMKLKSIADGSAAGIAILSPTEGATFTKMTASWTKQLRVIARSKPVPTARVVLFNALPKDQEKLKEVLLNSRSDPEAKEILEELRLVGFSEP